MHVWPPRIDCELLESKAYTLFPRPPPAQLSLAQDVLSVPQILTLRSFRAGKGPHPLDLGSNPTCFLHVNLAWAASSVKREQVPFKGVGVRIELDKVKGKCFNSL